MPGTARGRPGFAPLARVVFSSPPARGARPAASPAQRGKTSAADGLRGVVMDSDPVPRYRPDGHGGMEKYMPGHVGTVYQAMSFLYLGTTDPQSQWLLPSGLVVSRRSALVRG
jgi:hypothetical protein